MLFLTISALLSVPGVAAAAPTPAWEISQLAGPTNFKPGDSKNPLYEVHVFNSGGLPTDGSTIVIEDTLPAGLTVKGIQMPLRARPGGFDNYASVACDQATAGGRVTVTCEIDESLFGLEPARIWPQEFIRLEIKVAVPPTASGTLENEVSVTGGGAAPVTDVLEHEASADPAQAGINEFETRLLGPDGLPEPLAASHPFAYVTSYATNTEIAPTGSQAPLLEVGGDPRNLEFDLPPGLIGNPTATPRCTAKQFSETPPLLVGGQSVLVSGCPDSSAVGTIAVRQIEGGPAGAISAALYNLAPPPGMPARFGFQLAGAPIYIDTEVRSGSDYGVTARVKNLSQTKRATAATVTLWGVPGDPAHNRQRGLCAETGGALVSCPAEGDPLPFLRLPTSCASSLESRMGLATWLLPNLLHEADRSDPAPVGCNQPEFAPTIEARPTTNVADSPTGLHVDLHIPQNEDPEGLSEADLRDATVTLPSGLAVNPASADGQGACGTAQIGFQGGAPGALRFSGSPAACPESSKIGTVAVHTPLLDHPLPGAVYLAAQEDNPFGSLLAIYIALDDPVSGVVVKLAGKVTPDPETGQLSAAFAGNPQLPFEDFELDFFGGARAPLRTPQTCGSFQTTTSLVPWTAPESASAHPTDAFQIAAAPGGGTCPGSKGDLPNSPRFEAGSSSAIAGAFSPFVLRLSRQDGSQEIKGLNVSLPAGLTARLAGVPECSEAQVAQALARSRPGEGADELASPSCPEASRIGGVTVGAGAGPAPFHVGGRVYLAGPYKGAPLSMLVVTPAVAGPFDLGAVAVRAALRVDPETAQVRVESDPIPTILQGIPLDVRSIAVQIDRSQFTLNPTSCEAMAIGAEAISTADQAAQLTNRFQVGGCAGLGFKPKLALKLKGGTKRDRNPALTATLTFPQAGGSNVASAQVALPRSTFLDQSHIRTVCTRVQFAAGACPKGSVYGRARAITPLLDQPLEGPVYLRSNGGERELPDLVADLRGKLQVVLVGYIDSKRGGIRTTFASVPDAPVAKFVLSMQGGNRGLLVNSTDICRRPQKATAGFTAHNGRKLTAKPVLKAKCKGKGKKGKRG